MVIASILFMYLHISSLPILEAIKTPSVCQVFRYVLQGEEEENERNIGWIQYMKEMNIIASKQQIGKGNRWEIICRDMDKVRRILEAECIYQQGKIAEMNERYDDVLKIFQVASNHGHLKSQIRSLRILKGWENDWKRLKSFKEYRKDLHRKLAYEYANGYKISIDDRDYLYQQYQAFKALPYRPKVRSVRSLERIKSKLDGTRFESKSSFAILKLKGITSEHTEELIKLTRSCKKACFELAGIHYRQEEFAMTAE